MRKIKVFSLYGDDALSIEEELQKKVDLWLNLNPLFFILSISSSISDSTILVTIIYDNGEIPKFDPIK